MKIIDVSDDEDNSLSIHIDDSSEVFAGKIVVSDNNSCIAININDWQAIKDAGDKLIADNKDG